MSYLLCAVTSFIFADLAEKKNSKLFLFFVAFILALFCGLRGVNVGVDTINYYNFLKYVLVLGVNFGSDVGFSFLSYIFMRIFNDPHVVLMIFSFVTNYLIIYRLWDFKDKSSFSLMVSIYFFLYYPYVFNIVRQCLAIAILFWATRYLEKNNLCSRTRHNSGKIIYIFFNILAFTIHFTAIIGFVYLIIIYRSYHHKKSRNLFIFGVFFLVIIALIIFRSNIIKYKQYFINITPSLHIMTLIRFLVLYLIIILSKIKNNKRYSITTKKIGIPMSKDIVSSYKLGIILYAMGMFFLFLNRIGLYFLVFEMPFWGQTVRANVNRWFYKLIIVGIICYYFIVFLFTDTSGIVEYSTYLS